MIRIRKTKCGFEKEPLLKPFGFKGGYVNELWQVASMLEGNSGISATGLGVQSVLWSDEAVFRKFGQDEGNNIMLSMTRYALSIAEGTSFDTPFDLLDRLFPVTYEYGRKITGLDDLCATFVLNALVSVDNAAWLLYCRENSIGSFDAMIPPEFRNVLSCRNKSLACVPLVTYGTTVEETVRIANDGYFFYKIKIGSDPAGDGSRDSMLEWDKARITELHNVLGDISISYIDNMHVPYYLDANGRYDSKDRLMRFLDHADRIGALERIILLEEPFPEEYTEDVSGIPVRLAADESAHSEKDVIERIKQGYKAIALKPIAKTMSMSLKMLKAAHDNGIPCFCADLTVNPVMVDWNKNIAARLAPIPGMKVGILESNGHQNYLNWQKMKTYHHFCGVRWTEPERGIFNIDDTFYDNSGGIFEEGGHYTGLLK